MPVGKMRHSLTIQAKSRSNDSAGGTRRTYSTLATVMGSIEPIGGNVRLYGDQIEGTTTHKITIRYRSDVTTKHRINYSADSRIFKINRIMNVGTRDRYLQMLCEEGVATP